MVGSPRKNRSDQTRKQLGPNRLEARLKSIVHADAATFRLGLHAAADLRVAFNVRLRKALLCEFLVGRIDPHFLPRQSGEFGCKHAEQPLRVLRPQIGKFRERQGLEPFRKRDCSAHTHVTRLAFCRRCCRLLNSPGRRSHLLRSRQALGIDPADVAPEYWRHLHNRIAAGHEPRAYTREQHAAWLKRRSVTP